MYDCLVGINLLREGLDIPEVGLVAVLDADKEGFLRSKTSLIQTCGRAARNVAGRVVLYADKETDSIRGAMAEMDRRRLLQTAHNKEHGITPRTVVKAIRELLDIEVESGEGRQPRGRGAKRRSPAAARGEAGSTPARKFHDRRELFDHVVKLRKDMAAAAKDLDFELAAQIRDEVFRLEQLDLEIR